MNAVKSDQNSVEPTSFEKRLYVCLIEIDSEFLFKWLLLRNQHSELIVFSNKAESSPQTLLFLPCCLVVALNFVSYDYGLVRNVESLNFVEKRW